MTLSAGSDAVGQKLAVDASGTTTAVWTQTNGTHYLVTTSQRPAGGSWSAPVTLSQAGQHAYTPQVEVDARGGAVAAWYRSDGGRDRVQVTTRTPDGAWSPVETLSAAGQSANGVRVAIDDSGTAAVVWSRSDGATIRIQASTHAVGGTWTTPVTLSEVGGDAISPAIAVDAGGTFTAAWTRYDGSYSLAQASSRPAGGDWSIPATLSEAGHGAARPRVAAGQAGSAVVVWTRSDGSNLRVQASSRQAGGPWSIATTLSKPGSDVFAGPIVGLDTSGNASAVWTQLIGGDTRAVAATRAPGGGWAVPETISPVGSTKGLVDLAVGRDGTTVAVWTLAGPGVTTQVQAALRHPGAAWSAGSPVSAFDGETVEPDAVVDPWGNASVAWFHYLPDTGRYRVQVAGLDAAGPVVGGFAVPATATAGQPVNLSLSAYDVWSAVAGTTWSFGDGTTASGASVSHTWTAPGTYTVTATVTDAVGNTTSRSSTATVGAAPAAAPARPAVSGLKLRPGTIHLTGPKKDRRAKVTVTVTTASKLTLTFKKKGVKKPLRLTKNLRAGRNTFTLTAKIGKKKRLTVGTWKVTAVATNAAGSSTARKLTLKVVR
ncbi:PKD domain-containing protein [Nocardioides exalbidus]|uniref:PKD domain-containing protein n=1 Tax=Nocardioides exalbidus TaxID=402596 RepID=UPI001FDF163E|nr:PKD domain-containing protein [Nocardioides exalbidus]